MGKFHQKCEIDGLGDLAEILTTYIHERSELKYFVTHVIFLKSKMAAAAILDLQEC